MLVELTLLVEPLIYPLGFARYLQPGHLGHTDCIPSPVPDLKFYPDMQMGYRPAPPAAAAPAWKAAPSCRGPA